MVVSKTNNVSGATNFPNGWTWTLTVSNSGSSAAFFEDQQTVLTDNLPNGNISYGTPTVSAVTGFFAGAIVCTISGSDLTCIASGTVQMEVNGGFQVSVAATPTAPGIFANPRAGGVCMVDPDSDVRELDETNNSCSDSVTSVLYQFVPDWWWFFTPPF